MAIAFDVFASGITTEFGSSITLTPTVASTSGRYALAFVMDGVSGKTATGVTALVGGSPTAMDFLGDSTESTDGARVQVWGLEGIDSGSQSIVASLTGSRGDRTVMIAVVYNGVDQTTSTGTVVSDDTSTNPSATASSETGGLVVAGLASRSGTEAVGAGQTLRGSYIVSTDTGAAGITGAVSDEPGAASVTMSWTGGGGFTAGLVAVPLKAAAAGSSSVANSTGVANAAVVFGALRLRTAAAAGVGTASVALNAIRRVTATVSGVGTASISMGAKRDATATAAGGGTAAITLGAKRLLTASAAGIGSASASASKIGSSTASAAGVATAVVVLGALRLAQVAAQGTAAASVTAFRLRGTESTAAGTSSTAADLHAIRAAIAASTGSSSTAVTLNVIRNLTVTVACGASVTAALSVNQEAASYTGKYAAEHADSLGALGAARGFSVEHASARADLGSAGR